jgi:hypothetical protein
MYKEVVDHSNDHMIGDRPACEDPNYNQPEIPVWYYQKCPRCGKFGKYTNWLSMGPGYDEWETPTSFQCKCGESW